jgi:DNA-directed RNA polymerase specialized sigma24 family protein
MYRFAEMLATDAQPGGCERLDFFEVLFDNALCALVSTECKRMRIHEQKIVPMLEQSSDDSDELEEAPADGKLDQWALGLSQPERGVFTGQVLAALAMLPQDEQEIMIYTILGLKSESLDDDEPTISDLCQVTSKTVRNRQKRAREKLENLKE